MNEFRVVVTQKALSSIQEHVSFVANVSPKAAKALYEEIMASLKSLARFPERSPEIVGLLVGTSKVRKMAIQKGRYVALYKTKSEEVVIYDVIDTRKDGILNRL